MPHTHQGPAKKADGGMSEARTYFDNAAYFRKVDRQLSFSPFHFLQLGRNRLLKHSSHSDSFKVGSVASRSSQSALARLRISIQF